jgi:hypothetical protein
VPTYLCTSFRQLAEIKSAFINGARALTQKIIKRLSFSYAQLTKSLYPHEDTRIEALGQTTHRGEADKNS